MAQKIKTLFLISDQLCSQVVRVLTFSYTKRAVIAGAFINNIRLSHFNMEAS